MSNYSSSYVLLTLKNDIPDELKIFLNKLLLLDYYEDTVSEEILCLPGIKEYLLSSDRWPSVFGCAHDSLCTPTKIEDRKLLSSENKTIAIEASHYYGLGTAGEFLKFVSPYLNRSVYNGIMLTDEYHSESECFYTLFCFGPKFELIEKSIKTQQGVDKFLKTFNSALHSSSE